MALITSAAENWQTRIFRIGGVREGELTLVKRTATSGSDYPGMPASLAKAHIRARLIPGRIHASFWHFSSRMTFLRRNQYGLFYNSFVLMP